MAAASDARSNLDLLDWKRRVFALYEETRSAADAHRAWERWRSYRDELFAAHPQSPIPEDGRDAFTGLSYFDYDPAARVLAEVRPAPRQTYEIGTSGEGSYSFTRFGVTAFGIASEEVELELYWLEGYGGGAFLPFRDATSGEETYGAGRYLLDTVKGADLGGEGDELVLDFNFAYNPSCSYEEIWVCPLAPPPNWLDVPIRAGERTPPVPPR
ncbi:MAG: DUF1684 domain-containing protein [Actinomycetota bacterium]